MKGQFKFNEDVGGLFINIIACYLIVLFTLGIWTPWAFCKIQRWRAKNTTIEGKKIKFIGEGSSLLGKFILWYFLTIITLPKNIPYILVTLLTSKLLISWLK